MARSLGAVGWRQGAASLAGWFLLLARLVVVSVAGNAIAGKASAGNASAGNASASNAPLVEACHASCTGLNAFVERMREVVKNETANDAERCLLVQGSHKTARCIFNWPTTCKDFYLSVYKTSKNCKKIGVNILEEKANTTFASATCQMCSSSRGASRQRSYYDHPPLPQCEAFCAKDATCSAFDYDATRSMCRTWTSCPGQARSKFGCQWTVYSKPGLVTPAQEPRPASNESVAPSLRPSRVGGAVPSLRPSRMGGASAAAPRRGAAAAWRALLATAPVAWAGLGSGR